MPEKTICYIEMPTAKRVTGTITYELECDGTEEDIRKAFEDDPTTFWNDYPLEVLEVVSEYDHNFTIESEHPNTAELSFELP